MSWRFDGKEPSAATMYGPYRNPVYREEPEDMELQSDPDGYYWADDYGSESERYASVVVAEMARDHNDIRWIK